MTNRDYEPEFRRVIDGREGQVFVVPHPWLTYVAQNLDGHLALWVRGLSETEKIPEDGRGYKVEVGRGRDGFSWRLVAEEPGLPSIFLTLIRHVLQATSEASNGEHAAEILVDSIAEFRRFYSRRSGRLTEEEMRGVFAELTFLEQLLDAGVAAEVAIESWRGPLASDGIGVHDFVFANGVSVEVKSSGLPAREIRTSDAGQLVPSSSTLYLAVLPLETVISDSRHGFMFKDYVEQIARRVVSRSQDLSDSWDRRMTALRLDLTDTYYLRWRFQPAEWMAFEVRDGFPFIPLQTVPRGINKISYSLELLTLAEFGTEFGAVLEEIGYSNEQ